MVSAHGELVFDSALRHIEDSRYLLDALIFEVKPRNGCLFLLGTALQGLVELLVAERGIGGVGSRKGYGIVQGSLVRTGLPTMVNITIIGDTEEPGAEFGEPQEGAGSHICPHQGVLGYVVGQGGVSRTQRKQEAP